MRANPDLSIAALLERYRDTREGAILERLAQWRLEIPEEEYQFEQEFADIVTYLRRRNDPREHLLETLLLRVRRARSALRNGKNCGAWASCKKSNF